MYRTGKGAIAKCCDNADRAEAEFCHEELAELHPGESSDPTKDLPQKREGALIGAHVVMH